MTTLPHDESCALVIFGASGDLTKRKLIPALWSMFQSRVLPEPFAVVGVARSEMTNEQFRARMREAISEFARVQPPSARVGSASPRPSSTLGGFADTGMYPGLTAYLKQVEQERGTSGNRLFYLSTPPSVYPHLVTRLGEAGLNRPAEHASGWVRIIIEKPFGRDLASAASLNQVVAGAFTEDQIYRIDHYLGKETVQNILVFRFANGIFEPLWNRRYVDHVQITVAEAIGVEGRGGYYEEAGALRDMIQNHLLQLLALVAMEPPVAFDADAGARREGQGAARDPRRSRPTRCAAYAVRGQYGPRLDRRAAGAGLPRGARASPPTPSTETFAALQALHRQLALGGRAVLPAHRQAAAEARDEIAIQFNARAAPRCSGAAAEVRSRSRTCSSLRIQPDEGISLRFGAKVPGRLRAADQAGEMDFRYGTAFGGEPPEAYERLLLDAMPGDSTLFARRDEVDDGVGADHADPRALGPAGDAAHVPQLRGRHLGPGGGRRR